MKESERDLLFNIGCDARINGTPLDACPFQTADEMIYWAAGWKDVDRNFGRDAKWPYLKLAEVN